MPSRSPQLRTVVHSHEFSQQLDAAIEADERVAEAMEGVEWTLVREPGFSLYPLVARTPSGQVIRACASQAIQSLPRIVVVFTVDEAGQLHFLAFRRSS